jgi:hypothetical protein
MEERLCAECNKPLPDAPYKYKYCPVCRSLYAIEQRSDGQGLPPKGRDRFTERLRDGFELIDDDDP